MPVELSFSLSTENSEQTPNIFLTKRIVKSYSGNKNKSPVRILTVAMSKYH